MQELLKYMPLEDGEKVLSQIDGVLYYFTPNSYLQILYSIIRFLAIITGRQIKAYIFVTNKRVILIQTQNFFWFYMGTSSVKSIPAHSIRSAGCYFTRTFILHENYYLEFISRSASCYISSKAGERSVHEMVRNILSLTSKQ